MDVFPALLENDVPFYSHEIEAYWNDIGNLDELRQGNLDALHGEVEIESDVPEVADGVRSASPLEGVEVEGPALIGSGVQLGAGARIQGPAIIGDGCRDRRRRLGARLDPARRRRAAAEGDAGRRHRGSRRQALTLS